MTVKVKVKAQPLKGVLPPKRPQAVLPRKLNLRGPDGTRLFLSSAITSAMLESTMEGASTLTLVCRDYGNKMLRTKPVKLRSTLVLDNVSYTLVKISHEADQLSITLEETAVNVLRRYSKPMKANRENTTRAQFIRKMVKEPREAIIPFECPELNIKQPIAAPTTPGGGTPPA